MVSQVPLKLIVGLGNPGAQYEHTRHNAGFWFIEALAQRYRAAFRYESRHQGELARVQIETQELWLLKPMTFINQSGGPTQSVMNFYKFTSPEVLVAYDELDFPPGVVRLKQGGGAAGHNGIRDLLAHIDTDFWRLRLGIGKPPAKGLEHVLSKPNAADAKAIHQSIAAAIEMLPCLLQKGGAAAMNQLHTQSEI